MLMHYVDASNLPYISMCSRIENFIYTMAKFNVSACTLMVCVSDPKCMQLCAAADFPCYDFQYGAFHPVCLSACVCACQHSGSVVKEMDH
jgi:hypothetical protein